MGEHAAGELINGYRIVGSLGRGGLGTTFEAVKNATGEHVALKQLAVADVADWKRFELFEREARVLASLEHQAIPRYLDHFMVEGPRGPTLYVVQAIVRGQSLAELVASRGPLDENAVRQIAGELLMVLAYLGQRSPPIVHRDIKPENVMRRTDGPIALVDFGAARADHAKPAGGSTTVGTYGYMAPEQLHGVALPATDIYGLACTMLFLLSGRSPADLPRQKLAIDFRPSMRTTPSLAAWLEKALAPAPEDRFPSAEIALAALRTGHIGGAAAPKKKTRAHTWVLAGVLGATLLGGTAFGGVLYMRERQLAQSNRAMTSAMKPPPLLPARWATLSHPQNVKMIRSIPAHLSAIFSVAVSPDGKQVVSGGNEGSVKLWDMETGEAVRVFPGQTGKVRSVAWMPDGSAVISGGGRGVLVQDAKTGAIRRSLEMAAGKAADGIAVSPDGKLIVAINNDGAVRGFNADTGATSFDGRQPTRLLQVAISPDGIAFATAQNDGSIGLWSTSSGKLSETRSGHMGPVDAIAWAPDGRVLFSVADDRTVKMWPMGTKNAVATAAEATDEVWGVATEPRGKHVATVSKDGYLRVYDALSLEIKGRADVSLGAANGPVLPPVPAVAFAPDGIRLVTGSAQGMISFLTLDVKSRPERVPVPLANAPEDRVAKTPAHKVYAEAISMAEKIEGDQAAYDKVVALLVAAIATDPKNALNHVAMARVERKRNRTTEGGHDKSTHPLGPGGPELEKAFALSPKLPEALIERGWVEQMQTDFVPARADAQQAVALGGISCDAEILLAELSLADGKDEEAEAHVLKAAPSCSRSQAFTLYRTARKVYWRQGDMAAFRRAFDVEIVASPWSAWARGNYAADLVELGDFDKAIEIGKQAVAQRNYGMVHRAIADAYAEKGAAALWNDGAMAIAKSNFDAAVVDEPTNARAHYGLAAYYRMVAIENRDKKALALSNRELDLALRSDPKMEIATKARQESAWIEKYLNHPPAK